MLHYLVSMLLNQPHTAASVLEQKGSTMAFWILLGSMAASVVIGVRQAGKGSDTLFPATAVAVLAIPLVVLLMYFTRRIIGDGEVAIAGVHCAGVFTIMVHFFCALRKEDRLVGG